MSIHCSSANGLTIREVKGVVYITGPVKTVYVHNGEVYPNTVGSVKESFLRKLLRKLSN